MMNDPLVLSNLIMDKLEAKGQNPINPLSDGKGISLWEAVSEGLIEYLKANAVTVDESGSWPLQ